MSSVIFLQKALIGGSGSVKLVYDRRGPFFAHVAPSAVPTAVRRRLTAPYASIPHPFVSPPLLVPPLSPLLASAFFPTLLPLSPLLSSRRQMATPAKAGGVGGGGPPGSGAGDADPDPGGELCGSSNPSKATRDAEVQYSVEYAAARSFAAAVKANPNGSHHIASSFGGV